MAQQPLLSQGLLIYEASLSHSDTPQSVGLLWTSDQPEAETTHYTHKGQDIQAPDEIRTRNPSKRAPADPRHRPRGHRDWQPRLQNGEIVYNNKKVRIPGNCKATAEGVWRGTVTDLRFLNLGIKW